MNSESARHHILCEPLRCQNAGSQRTDLAAELSLKLHCGVTLRLRQLHRWNQRIKLSCSAPGHELHVCWALLDSIDVSLCEPLWCQNAGSERTDLATDISLELHCGVALRFRRPRRWNQGLQLLRLTPGHELHVCWALLDSIDVLLCGPLWCQNAGSERTDLAAEL